MKRFGLFLATLFFTSGAWAGFSLAPNVGTAAGTEDFESSTCNNPANADDAAKGCAFVDTLAPGVASGGNVNRNLGPASAPPVFLGGTTLSSLTIQSNQHGTTGGLTPLANSTDLSLGSKAGEDELDQVGLVTFFPAAAVGSNSIFHNLIGDSLDLVFGPPVAGVSFNPLFLGDPNVIPPAGTGSLSIQVFGADGTTLLGPAFGLAGVNAANNTFVSIVATGGDFIGRINLFAPGGLGSAGVDNITVFAPEPATSALLVLGMAGLGFRARRRAQNS